MLRSKTNLANPVIIIFSLIFYATFGINNLPVLIIPIVCDYLFALIISKISDSKIKQSFLIVFVSFNLFILFYFKYAGFFLDVTSLLTANNLINLLRSRLVNLSIPIGISFITFQNVSYLIDVYKKKIPPERNLIKFAAYASLFPHLLSGPIVRFSEIKEQLSKRMINRDTIFAAFWMLSLGLFFKILIADTLFPLQEQITANLTSAGTLNIIILILTFSFRIYFDFWGYSLIALGLAKFIGFDFPINFNDPYKSGSVTEFWRRWNITLSNWLRDYIYIPLGGNRKGIVRNLLNLLVTMFLAGLWHGASWNFVFWGIIHGLLLICEKLAGYFRFNIPFWKPLGKPVTFIIICITWLPFMLKDNHQLLTAVHGLLSFDFALTGSLITSLIVNLPALLLAVYFSFMVNQTRLLKVKPSYLTIIICMFVFIISLAGSFIHENVNFIYFQF